VAHDRAVDAVRPRSRATRVGSGDASDQPQAYLWTADLLPPGLGIGIEASGTLDDVTTLPPGPRLPMLVQTYVFGRYRHRWLPALRRRYGDVFSLQIAPRRRRLVIVARPDLIREIFAGSATRFHAGESSAILEPLMGSHSVLLLDEDDHLVARKRLMPAFNGAALRGYRDLVAEIAREKVDGWPTGSPVALQPRLQTVTLEVIMRAVFGVTDDDRLAEIRPLVERIVSVRPLIMLAGYYPRLRRYGPWRRHLEIQNRLDDRLYAEIAGRRGVDGLDQRRDVLSRLLSTSDGSWTDEQLRDQLVTLLLAGHETTATALAWAFHELARHPEEQAAARQAADRGDDTTLNAVAKETLRLHPVIYEVGRVLTEPTGIGGYDLPAGVSVMPAIGLVHADRRQHPSPARFDPTRFLGDDQPSSHAWLPFGGGVRRCLGAGFSLMESEVILREVLTRFEMRPATPRPEPAIARNVTLAPARGARVVLSARDQGVR
jgi:cytochrome P450